MFNKLYSKILQWAAAEKAPYYLAVLSFAESSFFPIPPDVMLVPMSLAIPRRAFYFATLTTITSVLGGVFGYYVGFVAYKTVALPLIEYLHYQKQYENIFEWFNVYGLWAVLFAGFAPIPYKLFTIGAGSLQMALIPFVIGSLLGRGARFFMLVFMIRFCRSKNAT